MDQAWTSSGGCQECLDQIQIEASKYKCYHSIYIRTVSSYCLFSTLLIQLKLVYWPFQKCNMHTLQSLTESLQGENRVFPVKFSHTGKNLFSLHGTPAMKTGFSLWEKLHRENLVFITGMGLQCILLTNNNRNINHFFANKVMKISILDKKQGLSLSNTYTIWIGSKIWDTVFPHIVSAENSSFLNLENPKVTVHKAKGHST